MATLIKVDQLHNGVYINTVKHYAWNMVEKER